MNITNEELSEFGQMPKLQYFRLAIIVPMQEEKPFVVQSPGYSCDDFLVQQGWYLFTAPGDDAILLGKENPEGIVVNNEIYPVYKILKYIKNINKEFLDYIL